MKKIGMIVCIAMLFALMLAVTGCGSAPSSAPSSTPDSVPDSVSVSVSASMSESAPESTPASVPASSTPDGEPSTTLPGTNYAPYTLTLPEGFTVTSEDPFTASGEEFSTINVSTTVVDGGIDAYTEELWMANMQSLSENYNAKFTPASFEKITVSGFMAVSTSGIMDYGTYAFHTRQLLVDNGRACYAFNFIDTTEGDHDEDFAAVIDSISFAPPPDLPYTIELPESFFVTSEVPFEAAARDGSSMNVLTASVSDMFGGLNIGKELGNMSVKMAIAMWTEEMYLASMNASPEMQKGTYTLERSEKMEVDGCPAVLFSGTLAREDGTFIQTQLMVGVGESLYVFTFTDSTPGDHAADFAAAIESISFA